jgi:hypothetical protein
MRMSCLRRRENSEGLIIRGRTVGVGVDFSLV